LQGQGGIALLPGTSVEHQYLHIQNLTLFVSI